MKRMRETISGKPREWRQLDGISGLQYFDGEDLQHDARVQYNKTFYRSCLAEQMQEKRQRYQKIEAQERAYTEQIEEINRMRGMLMDSQNEKKKSQRISARELNLELARQKKEKEEGERRKQVEQEKEQVVRSIRRGQKQPYP